jgi:hypothetical protein
MGFYNDFSVALLGVRLTDSSKKFATKRSTYLRTTELSKIDEQVIGQIEEHGSALISVGRQCKDDFAWTYSLGIYDTCGQPELIVIGLPSKVAKACLRTGSLPAGRKGSRQDSRLNSRFLIRTRTSEPVQQGPSVTLPSMITPLFSGPFSHIVPRRL